MVAFLMRDKIINGKLRINILLKERLNETFSESLNHYV